MTTQKHPGDGTVLIGQYVGEIEPYKHYMNIFSKNPMDIERIRVVFKPALKIPKGLLKSGVLLVTELRSGRYTGNISKGDPSTYNYWEVQKVFVETDSPDFIWSKPSGANTTGPVFHRLTPSQKEIFRSIFENALDSFVFTDKL
jgi:hypothetical protein